MVLSSSWLIISVICVSFIICLPGNQLYSGIPTIISEIDEELGCGGSSAKMRKDKKGVPERDGVLSANNTFYRKTEFGPVHNGNRAGRMRTRHSCSSRSSQSSSALPSCEPDGSPVLPSCIPVSSSCEEKEKGYPFSSKPVNTKRSNAVRGNSFLHTPYIYPPLKKGSIGNSAI